MVGLIPQTTDNLSVLCSIPIEGGGNIQTNQHYFDFGRTLILNTPYVTHTSKGLVG